MHRCIDVKGPIIDNCCQQSSSRNTSPWPSNPFPAPVLYTLPTTSNVSYMLIFPSSSLPPSFLSFKHHFELCQANPTATNQHNRYSSPKMPLCRLVVGPNGLQSSKENNCDLYTSQSTMPEHGIVTCTHTPTHVCLLIAYCVCMCVHACVYVCAVGCMCVCTHTYVRLHVCVLRTCASK